MTHKKAIIKKVEIPAELEQVANEYQLTIDTSGNLFYFLRCVVTNAPLKSYRPYILAGLTTEKLETDILQAVANYDPRPLQVPVGSKRVARGHRHTVYVEAQ